MQRWWRSKLRRTTDEPIGGFELRGREHMNVLRPIVGQHLLHDAAGKPQCLIRIAFDAVEDDEAGTRGARLKSR